ncbi:hypothetical protein KP509_08G029000 [Ceratopteris richardii]|uniref:Uncharacterized protein n=1 Tax=Ceratopteris richardii TaxID=49495 RepID=A0A8T2U989_CERRI|nr:hypothetical protein KP509_08G029000 [Ceratopteris richardii]
MLVKWGYQQIINRCYKGIVKIVMDNRFAKMRPTVSQWPSMHDNDQPECMLHMHLGHLKDGYTNDRYWQVEANTMLISTWKILMSILTGWRQGSVSSWKCLNLQCISSVKDILWIKTATILVFVNGIFFRNEL